ncbi:insulinase family protein, partial [Aduncisulcus paluster]
VEADVQDFEKAVVANWPAKTKTAAQAEDAGPGEAATIELANGRKLVFIPDETLPYTAMSMYWVGGDADLSPEEQGLAAMVSQSLTRGTK